MAFFDDKKLLLSHIRHSFVTSDDTGMCELIMVNEDVEQEIENDQSFQKKSLRMQKRFMEAEKRSRGGHTNIVASYDIQASPTLSRRPPMKNTSDMFQFLGTKKKKASQVKSIPWQITPIELVDRSLFAPRPLKPRPSGPSPLSKLLAEQDKKKSNPFFKYSKFNGENHGPSATNKYYVYIAMAKDPLNPVEITVLHNATVEDLVGVTFWKYYEKGREPFPVKTVQNYSVMIADDDGEIDIDLPELQRDDFISKFGFRYLGIIERTGMDVQTKEDENSSKYKIVKVYYGDGGFSTIALNEPDVEMSEILARVVRKRRLQMHGYELERKDTPGELVNLGTMLSSQGTVDFMLVANTRQNQKVTSEENDEDSPDVGDEITSRLYTSYSVVMLQKMRSNTKVQLGIDSQRVEIQPTESSGRGFLKQQLKPMTYDVADISSIDIIDEKTAGTSIFRISRTSKEGIKNMDFEAPSYVTKKIVSKINHLLDDLPTTLKAKTGVSTKTKSKSLDA